MRTLVVLFITLVLTAAGIAVLAGRGAWTTPGSAACGCPTGVVPCPPVTR